MQDVPQKSSEAGPETNPYSTPCGYPIADDGSAGGEYACCIDINSPDARLIAAAPELLEALEASSAIVCSLSCESVKTSDRPWHHSPLCEQVAAAIAKARGL